MFGNPQQHAITLFTYLEIYSFLLRHDFEKISRVCVFDTRNTISVQYSTLECFRGFPWLQLTVTRGHPSMLREPT